MPSATEAGPLDDVYAYIEGNRTTFLRTLFRLLRQPSISAQDVGVEECAQLERDLMTECGLDALLIPTAGKPIVFGRRIDAGLGTTLLIYGHYDVQPVDPIESWISPPFEPIVRNGRVVARGSSDNKGQHLAQLLAIKSYLAVRGSLPINVKVVLEGQEESGSPHLRSFVEQNRELLAADLAYVSDGSVHDSGRSQVIFGVRGTLQVELVVHGANSDLHSGGRGGLVPDAARLLVELLGSMLGADGRVAIPGFYRDVRPPTAMELRAIASLPLDLPAFFKDMGTASLPPPVGPGFYERLMFLPTLTICTLQSGYFGQGFRTAIPSTARAKIDMRLVPDQDPDEVFRAFADHVRAVAPEVDIIRHGSMAPSRTEIESPLSAAVIAGVKSVEGEEPLIIPSLGGSLPTYVFTEILGIPAFIVPYANADQLNHAPNENMELERFYKGVKIAASVMQSIANAEEGARLPRTAGARFVANG